MILSFKGFSEIFWVGVGLLDFFVNSNNDLLSSAKNIIDDSLNNGQINTAFNGVEASEGYTIVSELTYGLLVIISLYFIYRFLKNLKIEVNWQFALALLPYIIFGPVARALEDAEYFKEPLVYWFISPLIYVLIAFFAISFIILGHYLVKKYKSSKITVNRVLFAGGLVLLIPSIIPVEPENHRFGPE